MVRLRVKAGRSHLNLNDLNLIDITKFNTAFSIPIQKQLDDGIWEDVTTLEFNPTPVIKPPTGNFPFTNLPFDISAGKILWDSRPVWGNGHPRTYTDHHEFDKEDPTKIEVAAGGHGIARKWFISGEGWSELSGGMSRVYQWSEHEGTVALFQKFIFGKGLENLSYELFSRHNQPMPVENKTGGLTFSIHEGEIGSKFESFHADYHDLGTKKLAKGIKQGDEVWVAIKANKNTNQYEIEGWIDYDHNGQWTSVGKFNHTETQNKAGTEKKPLYWRWRTNGPAPENIRAWDTIFMQL
jgi:hypothetical protein